MTLSTQPIPLSRIKTQTAGFHLTDSLLNIFETEFNKNTITSGFITRPIVRALAGATGDEFSAANNEQADTEEMQDIEQGTEQDTEQDDAQAQGQAHESPIDMIILNFRDPDYGPESGGFHPVEIAIARNGDLLYVTDFAYVGSGYFAELDRELDFDFAGQHFVHGNRAYALQTGRAMFELWQANFCSYYRMGAYTVEVTVV